MSDSDGPAWKDLFLGRELELSTLREAWREASEGSPKLVVLLAETGLGKTRLVQQFYAWLSTTHDQPGADGYWPDRLELEENSLSVNPGFPDRSSPPPIPWLWWGLRFTNPGLRNRAEGSDCGLVSSLPKLAPHFAPLQRAKERRGESIDVGVGSMAALAGLLGLATLGPVAAGVVAAVGALTALRDNLELLNSARKLVGLRQADAASVADEALSQRVDAVDRVASYMEALLEMGSDGRGGVPVVLVLDDAQWIDPDTLAFVTRVFRRASAEGWPLLVVATHWERDWLEQRIDSSASESLAAFVAENAELVGERWEPLTLAPVAAADLAAIVAAALPGLSERQRALVLERVGGSPGYLSDLLTVLTTTKRRFFRGNDPTQPLKEGAEQRLEALTALDHYQLNVQRFGELEQEIRDLLSWASHQGTRFVDGLALDVARRLGGDDRAVLLAQATDPYAVIDAVSTASHEFRHRAIHQIANQELREIESDFAEFRDALPWGAARMAG